MDPIRIIFLDVDGVINYRYTRTRTCDGWCFVDDFLVERLAALVQRSNARIVLSSTWRDGWNRQDESLNESYFNELRYKLNEYNIEIWDALPLPIRQERGEAIRLWFQDHSDLNIESYVIIDDWDDMGEYSDHLVWTNPTFGLTEENVEEAIHILNV